MREHEPITSASIIAAGYVTNAADERVELHSNTSLAQCEFLQRLVRETSARRCLEVGLAYGISSLAICEAAAAVASDASLISIDPYQNASWGGIGLLNLERAGFSGMVEHHQRPSYEVLPELLAGGREIDFAYVDSLKVFDILMVDVFFLTRLLRVGGVLVLDDCDWPGVRKLVRYMAGLPHWSVRARFGAIKASRRRTWSSAIARNVPFRNKIFRDDMAVPDDALGVSAACVAFEKTGEDTRRWDWFNG